MAARHVTFWRMKVQPGKVRYRKGDHELMPNIFVGEMHPPKGGNPDDVFTIGAMVSDRNEQ